MTDREAFIRRICEEPDEDVHRLVYADWLDENGESERAEFIRVQVAKERLNDVGVGKSTVEEDLAFHFYCARERELLTAGKAMVWGQDSALWDAGLKVPCYTANYYHPPPAHGFGTLFTRGFVSRVTLSQADFLRHARDIFAAHPVTAVTLSDKNTDWVHLWNESNITEDAQNENIASELFEVAWEQNPDAQRSADSPTPWLCFVNNQELRAALSAACVAHGRERAKLPALVTAASPSPAASRG